MKNNEVSWLMNWFDLHCNGCWEHMHGILIETGENPGWTINIVLEDTDLESQEFIRIDREKSSDNWLHCFIENKKFIAKVSSANLLESINIFRNWAGPLYKEIDQMPPVAISDKQFLWLIKWYDNLINKGLTSQNRIQIVTLDNPGWDFYIDLKGTGLERDNFQPIHVDRTESDWYHIFIRDNIFYGPGGNFNLGEVLAVFTNFVEGNRDKIQEIQKLPVDNP